MADDTFIEILTPRLRLTRMRPTHAAAFAAYRGNEDVARYQSWTSFSLRDAETFIAKMEKQHPDTAGEWFQFAVEERESGDLVGDCALGIDGDDERLVEVGFTIAPAFQRSGFGTEAVRALLSYVFKQRRKHRVSATTDVLNAGSIGLLEAVGMRREAHFRQNIWFKGGWGDEYVYAMCEDECPSI